MATIQSISVGQLAESAVGVEAWLPSVIALVGVLIASLINSRAMIRAENRRHDNALEQERQERLVDARYALYVRIEAARVGVVAALRLVHRDVQPGAQPPRVQEVERAVQHAATELSTLVDEASLFASSKVAELCRETARLAESAASGLRSAVFFREKNPIEINDDVESLAAWVTTGQGEVAGHLMRLEEQADNPTALPGGITVPMPATGVPGSPIVIPHMPPQIAAREVTRHQASQCGLDAATVELLAMRALTDQEVRWQARAGLRVAAMLLAALRAELGSDSTQRTS